jgi:hypothetical protein
MGREKEEGRRKKREVYQFWKGCYIRTYAVRTGFLPRDFATKPRFFAETRFLWWKFLYNRI